jgi:hypothetical protein
VKTKGDSNDPSVAAIAHFVHDSPSRVAWCGWYVCALRLGTDRGHCPRDRQA